MNFNDALFSDFLEVIGYNLPALIAMLVGAVLASANRHRHPAAARWAAFGFCWLFLVALVSIAWRTIGVVIVFANNPPMTWNEVLSYLFLSGCEAFGYICFVVALSATRQPPRNQHYYDDLANEPRRRTE